MNTKKRLFIAVVFMFLLFFLMTFAGGDDNEAIVNVEFIDGFNNSTIDLQEVEVGDNAIVPEEPEHSDYIFAGWFLYDDQDLRVTDFDEITEDLKVIALYAGDKNNNGINDEDDKSYTVTFVDSITNNVIDTQTVLEGMDANVPVVPTHDGYTFTGWDNGYTDVISNVTVSAEYVEVEDVDNTEDENDEALIYTVTFVDGDTGSVIVRQNVQEGNTASLPAVPTHENRVFKEWSGEYRNIRSNRTITAVYTNDLNGDGIADDSQPHFDVIYYDYNKEIIETKKDVLINMPTPTIDNPHRDNYTFEGWTPSIEDTVTQKSEYTATYKPVHDKNNNGIADEDEEKYVVSYAVDGSVVKTFPNLLKGIDTPTTDIIPEKDNYVFVNWGDVEKTVSKTVTYNAVWADDKNNNDKDDELDEKFTITYYNDKDVVKVFENVLVGLSTPVPEKALEPSKDGYVFDGWGEVSKIVTKKADYYAQWAIDSDKDGYADTAQYEVKFDVDGKIIDIQYLNKDEMPVLPVIDEELIPELKVFDTWTPEVKANQEETYKVVWTDDLDDDGVADKYEIEIKFVIDEEVVSTQYLKEDEMPKVPSPKKDGYVLSAWSPEIVKSTKNQTYTASWLVDSDKDGYADNDQYEVKFDVDGKIIDTQYLNKDEMPVLPVIDEELIPELKVFDTWTPEVKANQEETYKVVWTDDVNSDGVADKLQYRIIFKALDEVLVDNYYNKDDVMPVPKDEDIPKKDGYVFYGWGEEVSKNVSETKTYIAVYEVDSNGNEKADKDEVKYIVRYLNDDGKEIKVFKDLLIDSTTPLLSEELNPKKDGYVFDGWKGFSKIVKGSVDYKPNWVLDTDKDGIGDKYEIEIKFVIDEEVVSTQYLKEDEMPKVPSPKKDGYVLSAWSPEIVKATKNQTYTASWLVDSDKDGYADNDQYEVKFDVDGKIIDTQYLNKDEMPVLPVIDEELIPELKVFDTWTPEVKANQEETYKVVWTDDLDDDGVADKLQYKVIFAVGEEVIDTQYLNKDEDVKLPKDPTKEGYVFTGWSPKVEKNKSETYVATFGKDINDNGVADEDEKKIAITYLNKDESVFETLYELINMPTPQPENKPVADGYVFDGWNNVDKLVSEEATYSANWLVDSDKDGVADKYEIEIKFVIDEEVVSTQYLKESEMPKVPSPKKDGYVLSVWSPEIVKATKNQTYTASWLVDSDKDGYADNNQYEVKFDVDGKIIDTQYLNKDEMPVLPVIDEELIPELKVFDTWTPEVKVNQEETYKVVWTDDVNSDGVADKLQYRIIFKALDEVLVDNYYNKDDVMPVPKDEDIPKKDGYVFYGWGEEVSKNVSETKTYIAVYEVDSDKDGYADRDQFEVKFVVDEEVVSTQYLNKDEMPEIPTLNKEGWILSDWSSEVVSNVSQTYTAQWLDKESPVVSVSSTLAEDSSKATIKVTASDDASGVKSVKYSLGEDSEKVVLESPYEFDVTANGTYIIYVEDNEGNVTTKSVEVNGIELAPSKDEETTFQDDFVTVTLGKVSGIIVNYDLDLNITTKEGVTIESVEYYQSVVGIFGGIWDFAAGTSSGEYLTLEEMESGKYDTTSVSVEEGSTSLDLHLSADSADKFTILVTYNYNGQLEKKLYKVRLAQFVD